MLDPEVCAGYNSTYHVRIFHISLFILMLCAELCAWSAKISRPKETNKRINGLTLKSKEAEVRVADGCTVSIELQFESRNRSLLQEDKTLFMASPTQKTWAGKTELKLTGVATPIRLLATSDDGNIEEEKLIVVLSSTEPLGLCLPKKPPKEEKPSVVKVIRVPVPVREEPRPAPLPAKAELPPINITIHTESGKAVVTNGNEVSKTAKVNVTTIKDPNEKPEPPKEVQRKIAIEAQLQSRADVEKPKNWWVSAGLGYRYVSYEEGAVAKSYSNFLDAMVVAGANITPRIGATGSAVLSVLSLSRNMPVASRYWALATTGNYSFHLQPMLKLKLHAGWGLRSFTASDDSFGIINANSPIFFPEVSWNLNASNALNVSAAWLPVIGFGFPPNRILDVSVKWIRTLPNSRLITVSLELTDMRLENTVASVLTSPVLIASYTF